MIIIGQIDIRTKEQIFFSLNSKKYQLDKMTSQVERTIKNNLKTNNTLRRSFFCFFQFVSFRCVRFFLTVFDMLTLILSNDDEFVH